MIKVKGRLKELEKQEATPQEFGEAIADLTKRLEKVGISEKTLPKSKQGKEISQRRIPTLFSVREGTSTDDLPTQDDQVRNYQWTQRRRFELQRSFRRLRRQRYNNTLESMVDPEQQLVISGRRRAQLAPAEVLYSYHRQTARHRVYQALQREGMQHIHIGLAMIRLHTLHRIGAGTNALVVLQDTRWSNTIRIISTMEVDLTQGTQLVYMVPDIMMSINDFHDHLRVSIQTHGYKAWQNGKSNLLVTLLMVGRLSNTSYVGFNYNIENVVDHLSTRGISAIPGERRTMEELEGQSWHLRPVENETGGELEVSRTKGKSVEMIFVCVRDVFINKESLLHIMCGFCVVKGGALRSEGGNFEEEGYQATTKLQGRVEQGGEQQSERCTELQEICKSKSGNDCEEVERGQYSKRDKPKEGDIVFLADLLAEGKRAVVINDGIQMLIGTNFIRAMQGGIRIEGDEITIYKKITKFKTSNQAEICQVAIDELEMDELEYQATVEESVFHQETNPEFKEKFEPIVVKRDNDQGFHQVVMEEESIPWTAFLAPGG
ncbi:hypothetical protein Tco_1284757 [Tanacetum coccineum]